MTEISWGWCGDPARAGDIARFFVAHADPSYISHSEMQFGRAGAPGRWSEALGAKIEADAERAIAGGAGGMRCALAQAGAAIVGLAFVRFVADAPSPFVVLEDLLVDPRRRGQGLGRRFIAWLVPQARAEGHARLFLESGVGNQAAHRFFETEGFAQTSIVMMRDL